MAQVVAQFKASDFFASDEERDELTLRCGAKVYVRQSLSAEQRGAFQRALMSLDLNMETQEVKLKDISWERQAILVCQAYIVDWDLPMAYESGVVPRLKGEVLDEIAEGIDRLQAVKKEMQEKKD